MDLKVFAAVLVAALLHAFWNALAKGGRVSRVDAQALGIGAGILAVPALVLLPLPARPSWPLLALSAVIHIGYFRLLGIAYREGALSVAYPLMRSTPPLLVGLASGIAFGEAVSPGGWAGMVALGAAVLLLAGEGLGTHAISGAGALAAAANIVVIAVYTLVDGAGVRASGDAASYAAWLFALTAAALLPFSTRATLRAARSQMGRTALGAVCTVGAYGIVLWAMTRAPVALVAALRETSVLFGAGLGALVFGERFGLARWGAVSLAVVGALAVRLA